VKTRAAKPGVRARVLENRRTSTRSTPTATTDEGRGGIRTTPP
jgi:hypothetical protein